jgi:hypothetical protein
LLPRVSSLSDEKLLDRLILLCGDLKRTDRDMSEAFIRFIKDGLRAQTFAKYGDRLLEKAGDVLDRGVESPMGVDVRRLRMDDL